MSELILTLQQGGNSQPVSLLQEESPQYCLPLLCEQAVQVGLSATLKVQLDHHAFKIDGQLRARQPSSQLDGCCLFRVERRFFMQARMLLQLYTIAAYKTRLERVQHNVTLDAAADDWIRKNAAHFSCCFENH